MPQAFITRRGGKQEFIPYQELFDASGTMTAPEDGTYRIIVVGAGADGGGYAADTSDTWTGGAWACAGGCGGGGYVDIAMKKGQTATITISDDGSVSVLIDGSVVIKATKGSTTGTYSNVKPLAGSVTGENVTPFPSNGTNTSSIALPEALNDPGSLSSGGESGLYSSNGSSSSVTSTRREKTSGGGAFGGDGGIGGDAVVVSANSNYYVGTSAGTSGSRGAGDGSGGNVQDTGFGSVVGYSGQAGGGGGGGYGGGGGAGTTHYNRINSSTTYYYVDKGGTGGKACAVIKRIA